MTLTITPEISLRLLRQDDAEEMFHIIDTQREHLGRWLPFLSATRTVDDCRAYIGVVTNYYEKMNEETFSIRYNDRFVGVVGFKSTDRSCWKTELGYWLSEPYQHKGIALRSVRFLCSRAFCELKMNRVQVKCPVGNEPSRAIPHRLGFTFEGIERDGVQMSHNYYVDLEVYSLIRRDFIHPSTQ